MYKKEEGGVYLLSYAYACVYIKIIKIYNLKITRAI
jgi:hypothetical protein